MTPAKTREGIARITRPLEAIVVLTVIYVLSSGPVLASGFWLRERTGWDGFYSVIWVYAPLLMWGHWQPLDMYISWWCNVLHTVGPG
jgi:hypothetical protein